MKPAEIFKIFRSSGALLDGHFILRSGLHSRQFFQCALVLQHAPLAAKLCGELAKKIDDEAIDTIISPAIGGIIVGQEIARIIGKRHIFVEKEDGKLVLRRGFSIVRGERFLVAEDVVTQGGRVKEAIDIVRAHGGIVTAVAVLVDRSTAELSLGTALHSLVKMPVETFSPAEIPADLKDVPAVKPGSK